MAEQNTGLTLPTLPEFPTQWGEKEEGRLQTLAEQKTQMEELYKTKFSPEAWKATPFPERAIRGLLPGTVFEPIIGALTPWQWGFDYGVTPKQAREKMQQAEEEYSELLRMQRVVTILPSIQNTLRALALTDITIITTREELDKYFKLSSIGFTEEEQAYVVEFARGLLATSKEDLVSGEPLGLKPITAEEIESLIGGTRPILQPSQILSTVAFSSDLNEIQLALQQAYPPVAGELDITKGKEVLLQEYLDMLKSLGIDTESGATLPEMAAEAFETLGSYKGWVMPTDDSGLPLVDPATGEPVIYIIDKDNYAWYGQEIIAYYDEDTGNLAPLSLQGVPLLTDEQKEHALVDLGQAAIISVWNTAHMGEQYVLNAIPMFIQTLARAPFGEPPEIPVTLKVTPERYMPPGLTSEELIATVGKRIPSEGLTELDLRIATAMQERTNFNAFDAREIEIQYAYEQDYNARQQAYKDDLVEFFTENPEWLPRPEWDEPITERWSEDWKSVFDPGYLAYQMASNIHVYIAVIASIGVTYATGNPWLGMGTAMGLFLPLETESLRADLIASGASYEQATALSIPGGALISSLECIGNIPILRAVAPQFFAGFKASFIRGLARNLLHYGVVTPAKIGFTETFLEEIPQEVLHNLIVQSVDENRHLLENIPEVVAQSLVAIAPLAFMGGGGEYINMKRHLSAVVQSQLDDMSKTFVDNGMSQDQADLLSYNYLTSTEEGMAQVQLAYDEATTYANPDSNTLTEANQGNVSYEDWEGTTGSSQDTLTEISNMESQLEEYNKGIEELEGNLEKMKERVEKAMLLAKTKQETKEITEIVAILEEQLEELTIKRDALVDSLIAKKRQVAEEPPGIVEIPEVSVQEETAAKTTVWGKSITPDLQQRFLNIVRALPKVLQDIVPSKVWINAQLGYQAIAYDDYSIAFQNKKYISPHVVAHELAHLWLVKNMALQPKVDNLSVAHAFAEAYGDVGFSEIIGIKEQSTRNKPTPIKETDVTRGAKEQFTEDVAIYLGYPDPETGMYEVPAEKVAFIEKYVLGAESISSAKLDYEMMDLVEAWFGISLKERIALAEKAGLREEVGHNKNLNNKDEIRAMALVRMKEKGVIPEVVKPTEVTSEEVEAVPMPEDVRQGLIEWADSLLDQVETRKPNSLHVIGIPEGEALVRTDSTGRPMMVVTLLMREGQLTLSTIASAEKKLANGRALLDVINYIKARKDVAFPPVAEMSPDALKIYNKISEREKAKDAGEEITEPRFDEEKVLPVRLPREVTLKEELNKTDMAVRTHPEISRNTRLSKKAIELRNEARRNWEAANEEAKLAIAKRMKLGKSFIAKSWDGMSDYEQGVVTLDFVPDGSLHFSMAREIADMEEFMEFLEEATGLPFTAIYERAARAKNISEASKEQLVKDFSENPEFRAILQDEKLLAIATQELNARNEIQGVEHPADELLTPEILALIDAIQYIYDMYKPYARYLMFMRTEPKVNALKERFPDAVKDGKESELILALELRNRGEYNSLWQFLERCTWGVYETGFDPRQMAAPDLRTKDVTMGSVIGASSLNMRTRVEFPGFGKFRKNLVQRMLSYVTQMEIQWEIEPELRNFQKLWDMAYWKFENKDEIKGGLDRWWGIMQGIPSNYGWWTRQARRVWRQSMTSIFLEPILSLRNSAQAINLHMDRTELFRFLIRGKQEISPIERIKAKRFYDIFVSQLGGLRKYVLLVGQPGLPGLNWLNKAADALNIYGWSDYLPRLWSFYAYFNKANRATTQFLKDNDVGKWLKNSGAMHLRQTERNFVLNHYLSRANDTFDLRVDGLEDITGAEMAAFYVARRNTDHTHFKYARWARGLIEQGNMGETLWNLFVFPRGYGQRVAWQAEKIVGLFKGETTWEEARGGFNDLIKLFIVAQLFSSLWKSLSGRERNPYDPFSILTQWTFGGLFVGAMQDVTELIRDAGMVVNIWGDETQREQAKGRLPGKLSDLAEMLVPFYRRVIDIWAAFEDTPDQDVYWLRKMREQWEEAYTVDELEKLDMTLWERMKKATLGANPPDSDAWEKSQKSMLESRDLLGTRDMQGRYYTLKNHGRVVASTTAGFPDIFVSDYAGSHELDIFFKDCEAQWKEYYSLPSSPSTIRKDWRLEHVEEEAMMLFWEKFGQSVFSPGSLEWEEVARLLLMWFSIYHIDQTMHKEWANWELDLTK